MPNVVFLFNERRENLATLRIVVDNLVDWLRADAFIINGRRGDKADWIL